MIIIRETTADDRETILAVERQAFSGHEDVPDLVAELLKDDSAEPIVSLLAFKDSEAVGHILFTKATMAEAPERLMYILAPLAVIPSHQKQGIGKQLIEAGITILDRTGTDLVFVLGHPAYYPRSGFKPAGVLGFDAPYPIPERNADAWMVLGINPVALHSLSGTVICANALNKPEHWQE